MTGSLHHLMQITHIPFMLELLLELTWLFTDLLALILIRHENSDSIFFLTLVLAMLQIMVPFNYTEFIDGLTLQVKNKQIPMSRINDAVYRILRVKFTMGLFENPLADNSLVNELGSQVSYQF